MIVKTILQVTVLQQADSLEEARTRLSRMGLDDIAYQLDEGDMIGEFHTITDGEVAPSQVVAELEAVDNDGSFFDELEA